MSPLWQDFLLPWQSKNTYENAHRIHNWNGPCHLLDNQYKGFPQFFIQSNLFKINRKIAKFYIYFPHGQSWKDAMVNRWAFFPNGQKKFAMVNMWPVSLLLSCSLVLLLATQAMMMMMTMLMKDNDDDSKWWQMTANDTKWQMTANDSKWWKMTANYYK